MARRPILENITGAIIEICRSGRRPEVLREHVLSRLRRAVQFDAAFWSMVDPATLLFTQPHQHEIPPDTIPFFVRNEFIEEDVNKWTDLARDRAGVRTLAAATAGHMTQSPRYREIFAPLGLGDELRAVFRVDGACWGYMCLHREAGARFSADEVRVVRRLAPHIAEAIRASILTSNVELLDLADAPGLVVVAPDGSMLSTTAAGERWLEELGGPAPARHGLPVEVHALAATLQHTDGSAPMLPRLRVRTRAGRWAVLHGSVRSRRELVAAILQEQYLPRAIAGQPIGPSGFSRRKKATRSAQASDQPATAATPAGVNRGVAGSQTFSKTNR